MTFIDTAPRGPMGDLCLLSGVDSDGFVEAGRRWHGAARPVPAATTSPIVLRPYQVRAVEAIERAREEGVRAAVVVAPTAAGKTTILGKLVTHALERGERVLFVAHRRELIDQAYSRFVAMGVAEIDVGVLMADDPRRRDAARVQVASIDTLRRRRLPPADVVIRDECHRALAATDRRVRESYPQAFHLGVTATPIGPGGRSLRAAYERLILVATPAELAAEGYIDTPLVYTVPPSEAPDLGGVRTRAGDYDERELEGRVNTERLVGNVVEHWNKLADGRRTLVFATSVRHSQNIVRRFSAAGIAAEHVDANTPKPQRAALLARIERGETRVASQVALFTEGTDLPSVKCIVLARPTQSLGLYLQMCGRGLRPWGGVQCLILGHAACAHTHRLPLSDRTWSLEPTPTGRARRAPAPTTCKHCYGVFEGRPETCPGCGEGLRPLPEVPIDHAARGSREPKGELTLATPEVMATLQPTYEDMIRSLTLRGRNPGQAFHRFVAKYGVKPPRRIFERLRDMAVTDVAAEHLRSLVDRYGDVRVAEAKYYSDAGHFASAEVVAAALAAADVLTL